MPEKPEITHEYERTGFWHGTHPLSAIYDELYNGLVPPSDNCATIEGECLRAATRIHYDLFNNGWGCNNWSGAVKFLQKQIHMLPDLNYSLLEYVYPYCHGEPFNSSLEDTVYEDMQVYVTSIVAGVVKSIAGKPFTMNEQDLDLFDCQEPSYEPDEEYDEDDEDPRAYYGEDDDDQDNE